MKKLFSKHYKNLCSLLLALMLCFAFSAFAKPIKAQTFVDVKEDAWYREVVEDVVNKKLMSGYGDGRFGPDDPLTRGMLAQILYNREHRTLELDPETETDSSQADTSIETTSSQSEFENVFSDIHPDAFYYKAANWCNETGCMKGYGDGRFGGNDLIDREQFMTALARFGSRYIQTFSASSLTAYPDAFLVSDFARFSMIWGAANNIVGSALNLNPQGLAKRCEAAKMLSVFEALLENPIENRIKGAMATGESHSLYLQKDGTAIARGFNYSGQCNVENWKDLAAIDAGNYFSLGLTDKGKVLSVGENSFGQCDTESWSEVISIAAGGLHSLGLKQDGSVLFAGNDEYGQSNVSGWNNIIQIAAGFEHSVGLKADGTVVAAGSNSDGQCNVEGWKDILAISAGYRHTIGLKKDGSLLFAGNNEQGQCDVEDWKNVAFIDCGGFSTTAITKDGTILAAGNNVNQQLDITGWNNVSALAAGTSHTLGLLENGSVLAAGMDTNGQCDVSNLVSIALPKFEKEFDPR